MQTADRLEHQRGWRAASSIAVLSLVVMAGVFSVTIGHHPLYDPDEGRYARVTQETLEAGEMIVPIFEGKIRLQKPPVIHWLQGGAYVTMGQSEAAARLPSVVFTLLTVALLMQVTAMLRDRAAAVIVGLLYMSMPLVEVVGRLCIIDPVLNFFWTAAFLCGYLAFRGERLDRPYWWGCVVSISMGLLTKGPIGLLPALVLVIWLAMSRRMKLVRWTGWLLAVVIVLLPLLAWVGAVIGEVGAKHAIELWKRETIDRMTGAGDHRQPFYYYLPVILAGFFPATALLPVPGIHYPLRRVRESLVVGTLEGYLALSVIVPLIVLSAMRGKLATYVLPLAAPVAIAAALPLRQWLSVREDHGQLGQSTRKLPDGLTTIAIVFTVALVVLTYVVSTLGSSHLVTLQPPYHPAAKRFVIGFGCIVPLFWVAAVLWRRAHLRGWSLTIMGVASAAVWAWIIFAGERPMTSPGSNKAMIAAIRQKLDAEGSTGKPYLMIFGSREPSVSFYANQVVPRIDALPPPKVEPPVGAVQLLIVERHKSEGLRKVFPALAAEFEPWLEWQRAEDMVLVLKRRRATSKP